MSEKISVVKEKQFTYKGYFDVKKAYKSLMGYIEDNMLYDLSEKEYEEENVPGKKTIVSNCDATRVLNDYFKINIKFKFSLSGVDEEVLINDSKTILTNGKATIAINAFLDYDAGAGPDSGPLKAFIDKVYSKYVGSSDLEEAKIQAGKDVADVIGRFKDLMHASIK